MAAFSLSDGLESLSRMAYTPRMGRTPPETDMPSDGLFGAPTLAGLAKHIDKLDMPHPGELRNDVGRNRHVVISAPATKEISLGSSLLLRSSLECISYCSRKCCTKMLPLVLVLARALLDLGLRLDLDLDLDLACSCVDSHESAFCRC